MRAHRWSHTRDSIQRAYGMLYLFEPISTTDIYSIQIVGGTLLLLSSTVQDVQGMPRVPVLPVASDEQSSERKRGKTAKKTRFVAGYCHDVGGPQWHCVESTPYRHRTAPARPSPDQTTLSSPPLPHSFSCFTFHRNTAILFIAREFELAHPRPTSFPQWAFTNPSLRCSS